MDFVNRSQQVRAGGPGGTHVTGGADSESRKHSGSRGSESKMYRLGSVVLLGLIAVLVIALIVMFTWGANGNQSKLVNKDQYQAVFINVNGTTGGQVYFGHIKDINSSYIDLQNVFYIQNQNGTSSNNSYTLVKLGCELHGPNDEMVINNSQVYFWENLKPTGQVTQKINQYYQQNPSGQNCSTSSASGSTNQSSTNTQSTGTTNPTTSQPTNTTKKP